MKALPLLLLAILVTGLIPVPVAAETANVSAGMSVTCKGPYDILVSLGIENFLPLAQARIYYNWISVCILVLIGVMASSRTTRFISILVPVMAALLMYFGWFTFADPSNPARLFGIVVVGAVLAVAAYMKGSLHERFGIAGPGSMMFNLVFFILILQATVGFVNSTALWDVNAAPTASTQYSNIDLQTEITSVSSVGGGMTDVTQIGTILTDMAFGCIKMFIAMGLALVAFSVTIGIIYPWIPASQFGIALLVLMQLGIYIIYYMAFMRFVYKPLGEGDF
jgi:hypothetical protein